MPEITIAGKKVLLRERLPAKEHYRAVGVIEKLWPMGDYSFEETVGPLMPMVESWEFEGDPQDIGVWGELDTFDEFMPLVSGLVEYITQRSKRATERAKNSESLPT